MEKKLIEYAPELSKKLEMVVRTSNPLSTNTVKVTGIARSILKTFEGEASGLKSKLMTLKELVSNMQTCSATLLNTISKLFHYAEIDKNRIHTMIESLRRGDNNPYNSYLKQLHRYLGQSKDGLKDFLTYYEQAEQQCKSVDQVCKEKLEEFADAEKKRKQIVTATATGTVGVAGGLSLLTGLFSFGASIPVTLGFGTVGAVAGGAAAGYAVDKTYEPNMQSSKKIVEDSKSEVKEIAHALTTIGGFSKELTMSMNASISILSFMLDDSKTLDSPLQLQLQREDEEIENGYVIIEKDLADQEDSHDNTNAENITSKSRENVVSDSIEHDHDHCVQAESGEENSTERCGMSLISALDTFVSNIKKTQHSLQNCEENQGV